MKRILIVEHIEEVTEALVAATCGNYKVYTCTNGTTALELLKVLHPDALIIDLVLPGIDGLSVLRSTACRPPVILALTPFVSDQILLDAEALGVGYISLLPCSVKAVVARLESLLT